MKKYYITNGVLHYEKCGLHKDTGDSFELADDQREFVIPEGVTWLAHGCFRHNSSIRSFVFPKGLTVIDGWAFQNCTALEEMVIPDSVAVSHARGLFSYCTALKKAVLPAGVTTIPSDMFKGCTALREIVIPEGVREIAASAFQDCAALEKIDIPQSVRIIGGNAFKGCTSLERIALPEGVTNIGWNVFEDCTALREVALLEGLSSIDMKGFAGCTSLREITLPESVRYIGWNAFFCCISLRHIAIKGSCNIDTGAFEGCGNLKEIELPSELALKHGMLEDIPCKIDEQSGMKLSMDRRILMGIGEEDAVKQSKITEIVIPEGVTHIACDVLGFKGKHNIERITLPESLQSIGDAAFKEHPYKEIVLPAGVRVIGASAFFGCHELERVVLNEGLRVIGKGAFAACGKLREIVIPASVECIERTAFENCESLERVILSGEVRTVGVDLFRGATKVPMHILPDSVRGLSDWTDEPYEFVPDGKVDAEPAKNKQLSGMLPYFGVRTIARLIVHQKGKAIVEEISRGLGENIGRVNLGAIAKAICEEVASLKKKAFDTAAAFFTDYAEQLSAEDIRAFIAVLEMKKAQKNLDALALNAAVQKKLSAQSDEPAEVNEHPMESTLGERTEKVFRKETIATLRKTARDMRSKEQIPDGIKYADGSPVSDAAFALMVCAAEGHLSLMPEHQLKEDGWQEVLPLVDALNKDRFTAAMHRIFDEKMYAKNASLVALMCVFGDEALLAKIISMKNKWADWYAWGTVGKELNRSIDHWTLYSPTREALVFADKNNRLGRYAQIHNTTEDALRNQLLADFGFNEQGVRIFRAGDAEIEVTLNPDASVQLYNRKTKKAVKTFPKKGEPNEGEVFAAWKKQLATVVKSRVKSMKDAFADGSMRSFDQWQAENCTNPIYTALAKGVVWGVYDEHGKYAFGFRLNENLETVNVDGEGIAVNAEMRIGVMHPVDCEWEELKQWKRAFSMIAQPLPQLDTPVRLPDADTLVSRYEGCRVNVGKLLHGMNGQQEEGTVTGGNDTVSVTIVNGYDYWSECEVDSVSVDESRAADKRKYSTDVLEMDNLLNPFKKAEAVIAEKDLDKVRDMVARSLIIRENIHGMISCAVEAGAVEISLYLIELSRQWGVAEDEDDLSL